MALTIDDCRPLLAGTWTWSEGLSGPDRLVDATQYGARVLWRETATETACTVEVTDGGRVLAMTAGEGDCASEALDVALSRADELLDVAAEV